MPKWSRVLFEAQWRYISLRGGRGSGKTKNVARSRVLKALEQPLRGLCTREVQDSIKESVYAQIVAEIEELGLVSQFDILRDEIRPKIGGTIIFKGLNDLSVSAIKSMANIDWCWIEEAQYVTAMSWNKLDPTIRAAGSQIILSWNPELETDFIYRKVVVEGLPDCANLFVNFDKNPWFPEVLRRQEQHMAAIDPVMHRHVWLGEPLPAVEGAIYFDEIARMEREARILNMLHDEQLNVYIIMDLGFNDYTSAGVVQQVAGERRYIDFVENHRVGLKWFSDEFKSRGYEGAIIVMPHDAEAKRMEANGVSMKEQMEAFGWEVEIVDNIPVEHGIRLVRESLPRTYMDKTRCAPLIEHLKRYQRTKTGHPLHDEHSHACDMVRYEAVHAPKMHNNRSSWGGPLNFQSVVTV